MSAVKKVIAVTSGKGGVGKSAVTALLACAVSELGHSAAILDADIAGSSIARMFAVAAGCRASALGLHPAVSQKGIQLMSFDLLAEREGDPVVWQGPRVAGLVLQFWSEVIWDAVDFLFIDMPPGTGDVPAAVFGSLPVDGVVAVTTPQRLVIETVEKAVLGAQGMGVPVLGFVENCSDFPAGQKRAAGLSILAGMPFDPELSAACDQGDVEAFSKNYLRDAAEKIINIPS